MNKLTIIVIIAAVLAGCSHQPAASTAAEPQEENRQAKALMQGIWRDAETDEVSIRVNGDTIFFADSLNMPTAFRVIGDSLVFASGASYAIEKQTDHLLWFLNQNGDLVKLQKSDNADDSSGFTHAPVVMTYTHQVKRDSVVNFGKERYHWYIAINPTKYKVLKRTFNDDGVEVVNEYYDNIMHISVYKGASCLFSSDFRKQQFSSQVPADFLESAVLGSMEYSHIDAAGLHFKAALCIPDGVSYWVELVISGKGELSFV